MAAQRYLDEAKVSSYICFIFTNEKFKRVNLVELDVCVWVMTFTFSVVIFISPEISETVADIQEPTEQVSKGKVRSDGSEFEMTRDKVRSSNERYSNLKASCDALMDRL